MTDQGAGDHVWLKGDGKGGHKSEEAAEHNLDASGQDVARLAQDGTQRVRRAYL